MTAGQVIGTADGLDLLLKEAAYRCSNPACRSAIAPETSTSVFVFQSGANQVENLLLLCQACGSQYHDGHFPQAAVQAWKILLLALNGIDVNAGELKNAAMRNYPGIAPFFPDGYFAYPGPGGKIYLDIKESRMMFARALGLYEPDKTQTIRSLLRPGMTFIDVGANKGDFSLLAAKIVGDTGAVLAFEPDPENLHWLARSVELNGYGNIKAFDVALGERNETVPLYLGDKSGWHSLVPSPTGHSRGTISINKRTLDSFLEELGNPDVHMIKIDVEGAELEVLHGAQRTLSGNSGVVLLLDIHPHMGVNPSDVFDFLGKHGFTMYCMNTPHEILTHADTNTREVLATRGRAP